jgi:hypothetical protein
MAPRSTCCRAVCGCVFSFIPRFAFFSSMTWLPRLIRCRMGCCTFLGIHGLFFIRWPFLTIFVPFKDARGVYVIMCVEESQIGGVWFERFTLPQLFFVIFLGFLPTHIYIYIYNTRCGADGFVPVLPSALSHIRQPLLE